MTDIHESEGAASWLTANARRFEAVLVGGDVTSWGRGEYLERFLRALKATRTPSFMVQGNHDPRAAGPYEMTKILHGTKVDYRGLLLGGIGGSNATPFGTPFEMTDQEAGEVLEELGGVDLLLSHCPPLNTKCDVTRSGQHVGSLPVREYVLRRRPRLVLSGHIHESRGVDLLGVTKVANPGPFAEGCYAVVDSEKLDVELKKEEFRNRR